MQRKNSAVAYYKVAAGYDKRFYETTFGTGLSILLAIVLWHGLNLLMTWGIFELAMWNSRKYMWLCTAMFPATIILLVIARMSGVRSNKKKRLLDFLGEFIVEKQAVIDEEQNRIKQEVEYNDKLAKQQAEKAV